MATLPNYGSSALGEPLSATSAWSIGGYSVHCRVPGPLRAGFDRAIFVAIRLASLEGFRSVPYEGPMSREDAKYLRSLGYLVSRSKISW